MVKRCSLCVRRALPFSPICPNLPIVCRRCAQIVKNLNAGVYWYHLGKEGYRILEKNGRNLKETENFKKKPFEKLLSSKVVDSSRDLNSVLIQNASFIQRIEQKTKGNIWTGAVHGVFTIKTYKLCSICGDKIFPALQGTHHHPSDTPRACSQCKRLLKDLQDPKNIITEEDGSIEVITGRRSGYFILDEALIKNIQKYKREEGT